MAHTLATVMEVNSPAPSVLAGFGGPGQRAVVPVDADDLCSPDRVFRRNEAEAAAGEFGLVSSGSVCSASMRGSLPPTG